MTKAVKAKVTTRELTVPVSRAGVAAGPFFFSVIIDAATTFVVDILADFELATLEPLKE